MAAEGRERTGRGGGEDGRKEEWNGGKGWNRVEGW